MVEKALLLTCVALLAILGISAVGAQLPKLMTQTECVMAKKQLCIIENPNQETLNPG
jgi:hypothetical protein